MTALEWRVEETCHKAWPALGEVRIGDWMLRTAPGISRRSNSLNPMNGDASDIDTTLAAARTLFGQAGLPVLFRIPTLLSPAVDRRLDALGFTAEGETTTLYRDLDGAAAEESADIECLPGADDAWFEAMHALQGHTMPQADAYRRVVKTIDVPAAFLRLAVDGQVAALAFGAVHDGLICCESVITDPGHRGQGHARRMVQALFAWAMARNAEGVCLQVVSDNHPALALYRALGMTRELYRYHYRRESSYYPPP